MASEKWLDKVVERAREALDKPSPYGVDIDITQYREALGSGFIDRSKADEIGVSLSSRALYVQIDQNYMRYFSKIPGVEVYSIDEFVESRPDEAREYVWRLIDPSTDKYTALAALRGRGGYFIRVKKNTRVEDPITACLFISSRGFQAPHNVVIVEEGAEATVYTGCAIAPEVLGLHVGISEFYVSRDAKLRFVMVHSWNKVSHVRPRTAVYVEEGGEYVSYYVNMARVKTLQTYPVVYLSRGSKAYLASIVLGLGDAVIDVGSKAVLIGDDSGVEIVSRSLAHDSSKITARASIIGESGRGHIDCRGLMISEKAVITTVPELEARTPNTILTHEASIGRIAEEEINYLVSKGFTRDEAIGILIRGFVSVEPRGVPEKIKRYIENIESILIQRL
ncbi:MAG: SufD family Fe-S cluster assembly protein [Sulfolobales archaeon]